MAEVTSKISVTKIGTSVRNKKSVYTATKVTKTQTQPITYQTEIIKYSDAKGSNPVVIGTRNPTTGKITFNDNASSQEKNYSATLGKTSTNQMSSPEVQALATNASETAALNSAAGTSNQAQGSGTSTQQQKGVVGGQGGNKSRYSSGANNNAGTSAASTGSESKPPPLNTTKPGSRLDGFPTLVFPEGLDSVDRDVLKIDMLRYIASGFGSIKDGGGMKSMGGGRGDLWKKKMIGSVTLPVPGGISDTNAVDWGSGTMNPIQAAAANFALKTLQDGFKAGADAAAAGTAAAGEA